MNLPKNTFIKDSKLRCVFEFPSANELYEEVSKKSY